MRFELFDGGDRDLLFVLGRGNDPDDDNLAWFIDRLTDAGFRVHAAVLPPNITDFEREYVRPIRRYLDTLPEARLMGHSTGGLILAHLQSSAPRVYLSPWWGMETDGLASLLLPLVRRLPVEKPLITLSSDGGGVGGLSNPRNPDPVAPAYLREIHRAQATLPSFREGGVVFCSFADTVVDVSAIGEHAPADAMHLYDGPHGFFSSDSREAVAERVIDALEGVSAATSDDS
jgi:hypothetical protein